VKKTKRPAKTGEAVRRSVRDKMGKEIIKKLSQALRWVK